MCTSLKAMTAYGAVVAAAFYFSLIESQLTWRRIQIPNEPEARRDFAFGYYSSRNFLVLFGGLAFESGADKNLRVLGDTWVLDIPGGRWYNVVSSPSPTARYGSVSGFYNDRFYVSVGCNLTACFGDTWSFHPGLFAWERLELGSTVLPQGRRAAAGGIYPGSNLMLISGGMDAFGGFFSDTLLLDLSQRLWFVVGHRQSTYDPSVPHARAQHANLLTSATGLLIFGGCLKHGPCPAGDLWLYRAQEHQWTSLQACPSARRNGMLAMLPAANSQLKQTNFAVLYGGEINGRQTFGSKVIPDEEIVLINLTDFQWSIRSAATSIMPRSVSSAGFASSPDGIYLFGGYDSKENVMLRDLWLLSGNPDNAPRLGQCSPPFFTLISLHGILMFISFGCLLQWAGTLAQYALTVTDPTFNWRYLHKLLQSLSCTLAIGGILCAFIFIADGRHFQSVHACLGICLVLIHVLLPLLSLWSGWYCPMRRAFWMQVHYWLGLFLMVASYVNISLGLFLAHSSTAVWACWFAYVFILLITFCIVQTTECCKYVP